MEKSYERELGNSQSIDKHQKDGKHYKGGKHQKGGRRYRGGKHQKSGKHHKRNNDKKATKRNIRSRKYYFSLTVLLVLYLVFFVFINIFTKDITFSETENRVLQSKPRFTIERLVEGRFTDKYEKYKVDQFFNRDFWISVKVKTENLLQRKVSNGVYKSSDNYLIADFDKPNEQAVTDNLNSIAEFTKKYKNIKQYMLISPTADSILSDKLPASAPVIDQLGYLDNYYKRVNEKLNGKMKIVDVSTNLLEHKDEYLFYKNDHHWTTLGAYYSYEKLMNSMDIKPTTIKDYDVNVVSNDFKGSLCSESGYDAREDDSINVYIPKDKDNQVVVNFKEEQKKSSSLYNSEKLNQKDKYQVFLGGNHPLVEIDTTSKNDKTLLVFKDSYANCFIPFLTTHFERIILVDPRYYYEDIDKLIEDEEVDEILYLYNANTFFNDTSLSPVLDNE